MSSVSVGGSGCNEDRNVFITNINASRSEPGREKPHRLISDQLKLIEGRQIKAHGSDELVVIDVGIKYLSVKLTQLLQKC